MADSNLNDIKKQLLENKKSQEAGDKTLIEAVDDVGNSIDMKVIFGDQNSGDKKNGDTGILIRGCHFTGSSKVIRVSEETIVEAYPFFAQRLYSLQNPSLIEESQNDDFEDSTLIESVQPQNSTLFDPTIR